MNEIRKKLDRTYKWHKLTLFNVALLKSIYKKINKKINMFFLKEVLFIWLLWENKIYAEKKYNLLSFHRSILITVRDF